MIFQWIQKHYAIDIEENLSLQHQLKAAKITIEGLEKTKNDYSNEILRLQSKLSLAKSCMGQTDTWLRHAECKA